MAGKDEFGNWLKRRRKALGLTQKELARQAGCAEITLRKVETGDLAPSPALAKALAKAVGASDSDLPGLVALARGIDGDLATAARRGRPRRPANLPAQLTPLIGREHDIAAVHKRLIADGARLVTLLGPPGVGKTRLASAVAEDVLEHFEHGAVFVRLAPVADPRQVAAAIAQALGLEMTGPNPPELQLRAYLEEKHLLLVLDNFEHLVAAAPLVDDLLRRCPWLYVLATSRQPLRLRGERQTTVRPLALPVQSTDASRLTAEDALRYSAVAFFADRAEAVQHDFAVTDANALAVAELCRRLDGLPLAIELVAARVKLLPPADLLARLRGPWLLSIDGLRDVSERQRTLSGAIGWSYDLLSTAEQTLFTWLSMFVGGFTLEAAEMVCGEILSPSLPLSVSPTWILDGIASLLEKSLLHRETGLYGQPRYTMLEMIRGYALERLAASGEGELIRMRHANCFQYILENANQSDFNPRRLLQNRIIDDEIHNLRAALAWAMEHDVQVALLLTAYLTYWFHQRGPYSEGIRLVEVSLALPGASAHTIPRARALYEAGLSMLYNGEDAKARDYVEESLALSQELEYARGEADALTLLARMALWWWQDREAAVQFLEKALACYRELQHPGGVSIALMYFTKIAIFEGDFDRAQALGEESLATAQQAGLQFTYPLNRLGEIAYATGDFQRARSFYERSLAMERQGGDIDISLETLIGLAMTTIRQKDFVTAHTFLDEWLWRGKKLGNERDPNLCGCYLYLATLVQEEGDYESAVRLYRASLPGIQIDRDEWSSWGIGLAGLAVALDQRDLAATLLSATEKTDVQTNRMWPIHHHDCARLLSEVRSNLSAERFDEAWAKGRTVAFEPLVEEAVSVLELTLRT